MDSMNLLNAASDNEPLRRNCGTMAVHNALMERFPQFRMNLAEIESGAQRRTTSTEAARTEPAIIKVVVHVVFNKEEENISDEQVKSQIDVLNHDFGASNQDLNKVPEVWKGLPLDSKIRFELATKDPSGQNTTGITRTQTTMEGFGQNDTVKFAADGGIDAWPTDKYLNIWVCNLRNSLLGYAQFPGGPPATDGVVILYKAFGTNGTAVPPFNLGRTCTHEVGHFLNLRHIWGDTERCEGTDFVADTPNQQLPNFNKPAFPHVSCSNGPNGDMFMNYMDYVDDDTMVMFTPGQVARMNATLDGPRNSLI
jgi:hypothetical protein